MKILNNHLIVICKNSYALALALFLLSLTLSAQDPYITTWKTDNPGGTNNSSILIKTYNMPGYNYDVDWDNDGVFDQFGITGGVIHDFGTPGTYTIRIQGDFLGIRMSTSADNLKLISIDQWGDIEWEYLYGAYQGAENMIYNATDAPDLSNVTNLSSMFEGATNFNGDLNNWDVSNVTHFSYMFSNAAGFNGNISDWNMVNAKYLSGMFNGAISFNRNIENWDVSNVYYFRSMFAEATSFQGDLENWVVSNANSMKSMFFRASSFNGNIENWDVSNVNEFSSMFSEASSFDRNLGNWQLYSGAHLPGMFSNSGMSVTNYDNTLIGWSTQSVYNRDLGAHGLKYCNGQSAREFLILANDWTINGDTYDCSVLPVDFIDFSGIQNNDKINLRWSTAQEINNKGFQIQKLGPDHQWENLGFVPAQSDEQSGTKYYKFLDYQPESGLNIYRLRQEDLDGTTSYSKTISIIFLDGTQYVNVFPNPSHSKFVYANFPHGGNYQLQIKNTLGHVVSNQTINVADRNKPIMINIPQSGIFYLNFSNGTSSFSKKVIILD